MRIISRLICSFTGHRPKGESVTYDEAAGKFTDVSATTYAVCKRCGCVCPAKVDVVSSTDSVANAQD